jgi:hypothetical protein
MKTSPWVLGRRQRHREKNREREKGEERKRERKRERKSEKRRLRTGGKRRNIQTSGFQDAEHQAIKE